jgi:hypothetical protein
LQNEADKAILKTKTEGKYENLFVVAGQKFSSSEDMGTTAQAREKIEMVLEAETPELMQQWIKVIRVQMLVSLQKMDSICGYTCLGIIRERATAVQQARDVQVIATVRKRRGSFLSKLIPLKEAMHKSSGTKEHKKMVKRRKSLRLEEEPKGEDAGARDLHVEDGESKDGESKDGEVATADSTAVGVHKMPEQDYASIQEIVETARAKRVTGLLDLGNQPANEGEGMDAGLLNLNRLYWDEAPDLTGLSITQLRTKANDLDGMECALTLINLTMLDMSECKLTEVDEGIGSLTQLEEFNLSENQIKELPGTVGKLGSLKVLTMFKNVLSKLPDELGQCSALEEVNFFNNKLIKLPVSFAGLTELTELNVGGNKLKTLPKTDAWTKLESFSCHQNTLIMLPSFAGMTALTFLKMDYNKVLGELPDFGTGMTNLSHLEINHCMYSKLPATIGSMTALKTINCNGNEITECEADFANLTALDTFNMSGNKKLASLPASVEKCASLRVFFFQDTAVTSIPDGLASLTKIERIIAPKAGLDAGAEATIAKLQPVTAGNGGWVKQI